MNGFEPKEVNTLIETSSQLGYNSDAGIIKTMRNGLLQFSDPKLYTRAVTEPMPQYENAENVEETLKQMNDEEDSSDTTNKKYKLQGVKRQKEDDNSKPQKEDDNQKPMLKSKTRGVDTQNKKDKRVPTYIDPRDRRPTDNIPQNLKVVRMYGEIDKEMDDAQ